MSLFHRPGQQRPHGEGDQGHQRQGADRPAAQRGQHLVVDQSRWLTSTCAGSEQNSSRSLRPAKSRLHGTCGKSNIIDHHAPTS